MESGRLAVCGIKSSLKTTVVIMCEMMVVKQWWSGVQIKMYFEVSPAELLNLPVAPATGK